MQNVLEVLIAKLSKLLVKPILHNFPLSLLTDSVVRGDIGINTKATTPVLALLLKESYQKFICLSISIF